MAGPKGLASWSQRVGLRRATPSPPRCGCDPHGETHGPQPSMPDESPPEGVRSSWRPAALRAAFSCDGGAEGTRAMEPAGGSTPCNPLSAAMRLRPPSSASIAHLRMLDMRGVVALCAASFVLRERRRSRRRIWAGANATHLTPHRAKPVRPLTDIQHCP